LTNWKTSSSKNLKCFNAKLRRKCYKFQRVVGIDELEECQQQIDDLKNSSVKELEDDITEIKNHIKKYKSAFAELENIDLQDDFFRQYRMLKALNDYATSQLVAAT